MTHSLTSIMTLLLKHIRLAAYPVGSLYTSSKSTDPHELFGGKWKPIQDTFLWCAGPKHAAGETGGAETHTQTVEEMPAHNHSSPDAAPGFFAGWGNKSGDGWVTAASQGTGGNWSTTNTGGARPSRLCPHGGLCMHGSALPRVEMLHG